RAGQADVQVIPVARVVVPRVGQLVEGGENDLAELQALRRTHGQEADAGPGQRAFPIAVAGLLRDPIHLPDRPQRLTEDLHAALSVVRVEDANLFVRHALAPQPLDQADDYGPLLLPRAAGPVGRDRAAADDFRGADADVCFRVLVGHA